MPSNQTLTPADRNAAIDAFTASIAGGSIEEYDGAQPADPSVATTTQTKLVVHTLGTPAAPDAVNGATTLNSIAPVNPLASGTRTWFRAKNAAGVAVRDGSIGTSNADLVVDTTTVTLGEPVTLSGSISIPATV